MTVGGGSKSWKRNGQILMTRKKKKMLKDIWKYTEVQECNVHGIEETSVAKHVLPHIAPELLMGSVVYTESCEAWSIGSLFFFLFSRGKLFASVSNSSTPGGNKSSTQPSIDKSHVILNTIFGRCNRAKLPKEMRSYPKNEFDREARRRK